MKNFKIKDFIFKCPVKFYIDLQVASMNHDLLGLRLGMIFKLKLKFLKKNQRNRIFFSFSLLNLLLTLISDICGLLSVYIYNIIVFKYHDVITRIALVLFT